jgi:hypothetical protein
MMNDKRRQEILTLTWGQIRDDFTYLRKTKTNEPREIPISDSLRKMFDFNPEDGFHLSEETRAFTLAKIEVKPKRSAPVRNRKGLAPVPDQISSAKSLKSLVGTRGFEPPTP